MGTDKSTSGFRSPELMTLSTRCLDPTVARCRAADIYFVMNIGPWKMKSLTRIGAHLFHWWSFEKVLAHARKITVAEHSPNRKCTIATLKIVLPLASGHRLFRSLPFLSIVRWVDSFYFTPQLSYLSKYKSLATQIQVSNALRSLRRQISIESQSKPYGYLSHEARLQILPDKYCYILTHSYSIKSRVCLPIRCLNGCAKSKWKIIEDMQIRRPRLVVYFT